jgi:CubicO group peptidase (beta-lactamase class C family)
LAKIAAAMAAKGGFDGVQLLSEPTFDAAHSDVVQKYDDILLEESRFAQGGFAEFRLGEHTDRILSEGRGSLLGGSNTHGLGGSFYGWGGSGGSAFIWSPQHEVGFAYTMNGMASYILGGPRTERIFSALFECLKKAS